MREPKAVAAQPHSDSATHLHLGSPHWAVMWDMDGTLVDTEPHWMNAQRQLAATHGIVWTDEDNLKVVGQSMEFVAKTLQQSGVEQPTVEIIRSLVEDVAATIQTKIPGLP